MSMNDGARVGWDTPCEWLHDSITRHVQTHVTETSIENYILDKPFMDATARGLRQVMGTERHDIAKLKRMDTDVKIIKNMLRKSVGLDWATAARRNKTSQLFPSGSSGRTVLPWKTYEKQHQKTGADSTYEYVRRHLMTLAFTHEWQP